MTIGKNKLLSLIFMHRLVHITACLACLFAGAILSAQEAERAKLQATIDGALDALYADSCDHLSNEQKQAKVRETIEASYDLNVIIRRAIGRNWRLMDESEQTQVLELVKQLVVKAYVKGMHGERRPQVELGSIVKVTEKRIEIESRVLLNDKTYYVVYRLARLSTGWEIYDIVAENISVVSNYRQQIDDHFRKGTGAELIIRLEELLESEDINENTKI